jgi:hypothetical protein
VLRAADIYWNPDKRWFIYGTGLRDAI